MAHYILHIDIEGDEGILDRREKFEKGVPGKTIFTPDTLNSEGLDP